MATWGKKKIKINKYQPENTLYYEYFTAVDAYFIKTVNHVDYGLGYNRIENEYRFDNDTGDAMMEALIDHILQFKCSGNEAEFIERYIKNNRFKEQS